MFTQKIYTTASYDLLTCFLVQICEDTEYLVVHNTEYPVVKNTPDLFYCD
jgi:hypothetical protein